MRKARPRLHGTSLIMQSGDAKQTVLERCGTTYLVLYLTNSVWTSIAETPYLSG